VGPEKHGIMPPLISLRLPGTCDFRHFPEQNIFYFPTSIDNHFSNQVVSPKRNIYIILI